MRSGDAPAMLKKSSCEMKSTREWLEGQLCNMRKELEQLLKGSAKIITTTKYCAKKNRKILYQQINCLEVDLAQCRTYAALSLSEKEETIRKMKQEVGTDRALWNFQRL